MKKFLSYLIALVLTVSVSLSSRAETGEDTVVFTLAGYGIIEQNSSEEDITRGEFASIIAKLLNLDETPGTLLSQTSYIDVPADYEHATSIEILTQIGLLNGVSVDRFEPKSLLKYEQAIKVLIQVTGYGDIAERSGGWFDGYLSVALQNNMLRGVELKNPFCRDDLYRLIYNTLDVRLLSEVISSKNDGTLEKTDDTLKDLVARGAEYRLFKHKGVILANSFTSISSPYPDLNDDEVVIYNTTLGESFVYRIGKTDAASFVGNAVEFYAKDNDGIYEILSIRESQENEVFTVKAHNKGVKSGNTYSYIDENKKTERLTLDSGEIKVIYNGTRVISPTDSIYNINDGYITFINNDTDKMIEVVMIWEYENAIAASFDGERFIFLNDTLFDSQLSLFVDKNDRTVKMLVTDGNGDIVESFEEERTVSIFKDVENTRYTIRVGDTVKEGVFDSISDEYISFNGEDYRKANSLGNSLLLGKNYSVYLNFENKISFIRDKNAKNYAYILDYERTGLSRNISAKLILPGLVDAGVEKNETDTTDTSTVPYLILQNDGICVLDFADRVKCGKNNYKGSSLLELLARSDMKIVSYELNENGEIKSISPLVKHGGNVTKFYKYSVWDRVFGGTDVEADSGFAINSDTKVVCVPIDSDNNIRLNASDEDFLMKINITAANNKFGYRVEGYDFNEETKKVRLLIAHADMDAGYTASVDVFSNRASIVAGTRFVRNSDTGEFEQILNVISGTEMKTLKPNTLSTEIATIENLREGDLICYMTNNNDLLQNVRVIEYIPGLSSEFESTNISSSVGKTFGTVIDVSYGEVDTDKYLLYTDLKVSVNGNSPRTFKVPDTNTPPVYVYESEEGSVKTSSLKELRPGSDKVYIFERSSDSLVRAIIIVR